MTDLLTRLARLDGSAGTPTDEAVSLDLARGAAARSRRRRTVGAGAGVGLTLALGAGLSITIVTQPQDAATQAEKRSGTELVSYDGEQPEGFEVAVVPEGFFVQGSDPYVFTVAPDGDTSHPLAFEDKLVVSLEDAIKAQGELEGDAVQVGGAEGAIRDSDSAVTLEFLQGDYDVVVQMWDSVGLTDDQLVEFAEGITVTDEARIPGGGGTDATVERVEGGFRITPKG